MIMKDKMRALTPEEETQEQRPDSMELRVIINAFARASVLSKQETERLRLEALALVDKMEDGE
jgi:hypothetical protein